MAVLVPTSLTDLNLYVMTVVIIPKYDIHTHTKEQWRSRKSDIENLKNKGCMVWHPPLINYLSPIFQQWNRQCTSKTQIYIYTRGLWKRITIFLHFPCKPYMRLKSYSQVLMCNPEWWRHMGTYNIQHHSAKSVEAFWLFLCLNCGVYDTITSNAVYRLFLFKVYLRNKETQQTLWVIVSIQYDGF